VFYPQDGGESHLALKLRHCYPIYYRSADYDTFLGFMNMYFRLAASASLADRNEQVLAASGLSLYEAPL